MLDILANSVSLSIPPNFMCLATIQNQLHELIEQFHTADRRQQAMGQDLVASVVGLLSADFYSSSAVSAPPPHALASPLAQPTLK